MRLRRTDPLRPPRPLPPGAAIDVLAISSPSKPDRIDAAAARLEQLGFRVRVAPNAFAVERTYLAGSDEARVGAINRAFRDPSCDAIFFARGGYGAMRILEGIDYDAFAANPRPVVGYSDLTALHQALAARTGFGSFHGPMLNFDIHEGLAPDVDAWMWAMLRGEAPLHWRFEPGQVLAHGVAEGVLFGGNLSLTHALLDTPFDFWIDDGIWFWEEVDESVYRIDRMLTTLRLSGRLRSIQGVMIGRLKDCGAEGDLGRFLDLFFADAGIPVVRDLPFGHHGNNLLLPVGARVRLDTSAGSFTVPDPVVLPV